MTSPPDMQTDRSLRPCLSRVLHEARSQVNVNEKSNVAGKKALRGGLTRCVRRLQKRGTPAFNARKESQNKTRSQLTAVKATMTRDRHFSREREMACERETNLQRQHTTLLWTTYPWIECTNREPTITKWRSAEWWCWRRPEENHRVVNYHKVQLEERAARKRRRAAHRWPR